MSMGRWPFWVRAAVAASALAASGAAFSQDFGRGLAAQLSIENVSHLLPGQYLWAEGEAQNVAAHSTEGPVRLSVSLGEQKLYVWRGERLIGAASVSTGAKGHSTPTGDFTILQKAAFHRSNIYSGAPMPWMQRLTWTGIALHAGHNPGHPASHGCIRLPYAFARDLYRLTRRGGAVNITEDAEQRYWLTLDPRVFEIDEAEPFETSDRPHWLLSPQLDYDLGAMLYW